MKKITVKTTLHALLFTSFFALAPLASTQAANPKDNVTSTAKISIISLKNPAENYGIHVGDKLTRTIVLSVPAPYQLPKTAFPKKRSETAGVQLVDLAIESEPKKAATLYTVRLDYQSYADHNQPTAMQLPKIMLTPTGGNKSINITIPAWQFWFSPLASSTLGEAGKALQADIKPPLLDDKTHKTSLIAFLGLTLASLIALLYMNADGRWLPFMGGAFAQAHRKIKKLSKAKGSKTQREEKQALVFIHQAFNQHYGANIFARDIERFVDMRPNFAKMRGEIEQFFNHSNHSLYSTAPRDSASVIQQLVSLSKQLRDCERGV